MIKKEIVRSVEEIDESILALEDAVKSTDDHDLKLTWWNRRKALLWLFGIEKEIL